MISCPESMIQGIEFLEVTFNAVKKITCLARLDNKEGLEEKCTYL